MDWRYPLDAKVEPYKLDKDTVEGLGTMMNRLGLRMGIFDMKITPRGELFWLEVNPQGQFLFLEGLGEIHSRRLSQSLSKEKPPTLMRMGNKARLSVL